MTHEERIPRAWRQPMVWLIAAIPLYSVVATVALFMVAGGPGATDDVAEPVRRTAQVQVADFSADARAQVLGVRMQVVRDVRGLRLYSVSGALDPRTTLQLALRHPTLAADDRVLDLVRDGDGWRTNATSLDLGHDWNLQLGPRNGSWRLQGRWQARSATALLQPAVGGTP
jgi:hypothetical protein